VATIVIPTRTDGTQLYSMRMTLGGVGFTLGLQWNDRDASWSLAISDSSGALLLVKKVTVGTPLTKNYATATLPSGEFIAIDTSGADIDPGLTDLGSRVLLTFTDAADLP
jgi:hypothetical protein